MDEVINELPVTVTGLDTRVPATGNGIWIHMVIQIRIFLPLDNHIPTSHLMFTAMGTTTKKDIGTTETTIVSASATTVNAMNVADIIVVTGTVDGVTGALNHIPTMCPPPGPALTLHDHLLSHAWLKKFLPPRTTNMRVIH